MKRRNWISIALIALVLIGTAGCDEADLLGDESRELEIHWDCSYKDAGFQPGQRQINSTPPPISGRQAQLTQWFNSAAIMADPTLANVFIPFATLVGENNAVASPGYIAWNPSWFQSIGDVNATVILAHELGHLAQFYQLVPAVPPSTAPFEGQADYISGWLARSSGTISAGEAQQYANFIEALQGPGNQNYPSGQQRAQLFLDGYNSAP